MIKAPTPPADREVREGQYVSTPVQYRIVKYHHGFFDKWAYSLERRRTFRILFWQFEQWEWVSGTSRSTMGDTTRWQHMYNVQEITPAPADYKYHYRAQVPKLIRSGAYKVLVDVDAFNRADAFLFRRYGFIWLCVKHSPMDVYEATSAKAMQWVREFNVPAHMVRVKQNQFA